MGRKKTVQDYHGLTKEQDFEWIGEKLPKNINTKTLWRCSEDHEWEAKYNAIQQGGGCPHCYGNLPKTIEDYRALAKLRGFEWVGEELPRNTKAKTRWRCKKKSHEWEAHYKGILQSNNCPHCANCVPKTRDDYHARAKTRGFEWIGEFPPNTNVVTLWRCPEGHAWEARYHDIKGHGCPECKDVVNGHRVSKPQRQLREMLDGELNYRCGRKFIDVALPDKMIAIEYDCWYWHAHRQEEDAERTADLLARGWRVLRIKTSTDMPTKQDVVQAIAKLENGELYAEIVLSDWGVGRTFAGWWAQRKTDSWKKGPVPISMDGGITYIEAQQLLLFGEL